MMEVEEASNNKSADPALLASGKLLIFEEMMKQKRVEIAKGYIRKHMVNGSSIY